MKLIQALWIIWRSLQKLRTERPDREKKKVFCIGYNGSIAHNHMAVLDVFDRLTPERKEKIELVVPMTYGTTKEYLSEVKAKLESTGIRYRQLTEFMDNDAMAEMWSGVGYFINAQTTDSLSASVLEAVYSGAVLFNASWLEYPEYKEFNVKYLSFSDYDQLYGLIVKAIDGDIPDDAVNDPGILDGTFSWSAARENWAQLIDRL